MSSPVAIVWINSRRFDPFDPKMELDCGFSKTARWCSFQLWTPTKRKMMLAFCGSVRFYGTTAKGGLSLQDRAEFKRLNWGTRSASSKVVPFPPWELHENGLTKVTRLGTVFRLWDNKVRDVENVFASGGTLGLQCAVNVVNYQRRGMDQ